MRISDWSSDVCSSDLADRDMVAVLAVIVEQFLDRDADRRAAAPDADEVGRFEAAIQHLHPEAPRVGEEIVRADEDFGVAHKVRSNPPGWRPQAATASGRGAVVADPPRKDRKRTRLNSSH